jgi:hypothetical protein
VADITAEDSYLISHITVKCLLVFELLTPEVNLELIWKNLPAGRFGI